MQLITQLLLGTEDKGFEPLHDVTRLTVFETVPFSQTWVILPLHSIYK
ncbi:hypothetical protein WZ342_2646 [Enterococcus faecalis]|nr:hypothetical protein WZ342_2646 [Enterococcus faecalis]